MAFREDREGVVRNSGHCYLHAIYLSMFSVSVREQAWVRVVGGLNAPGPFIVVWGETRSGETVGSRS